VSLLPMRHLASYVPDGLDPTAGRIVPARTATACIMMQADGYSLVDVFESELESRL